MDRRRRALIVVDVQRDFCPGGSLPVKSGNRVVGPINELVSQFEKEGSPVFFTRDWHPADHCSFVSRGGPWPPHCVKGTLGAEFHPELYVPTDAVIISKATKKDREAYSGFQGTQLAEQLRRRGVKDVYVAGLATDYCVKNTVLDALREGFVASVVEDAVAGVNVKPTDSANAFRKMLSEGARRVSAKKALRNGSRRAAVSSSS